MKAYKGFNQEMTFRGVCKGRRMMKPALTQVIIDYAMEQAKRLKGIYPKGLSSKQLAKEFHTTPQSAASTMSAHDFFQFDHKYAIGDVAAMLAFRWQQGK